MSQVAYTNVAHILKEEMDSVLLMPGGSIAAGNISRAAQRIAWDLRATPGFDAWQRLQEAGLEGFESAFKQMFDKI